MDQKHLLTQALGFLQAQRRHRWWLRTVTGMAAMVVFVTTYLLILPAITMENSIFDVTAEPPEASLGERIHSEVYAVADDGREETFFVLTADGDNAGLDERRLDFDHNDVAVIQDEDGQNIELHREYTESGEVNYWFVLEQGQSASFSLPWVNGVDRWRMEIHEKWIYPEVVPEEPEQEPVPEPEPEPTPEPEPEPEPEPTPEPEPEPEPTPTPEPEPEPGPEPTPEPEPEPGPEPTPEPEPEPEETDDAELLFLGFFSRADALTIDELLPDWWGAEQEEPEQEEPQPELVYETELVRDQRGDREEAGELTLSFGSGRSLETAKRNAAKNQQSLLWLEEPEPEDQPPEYLCGREEHRHSLEACYNRFGDLICTLEEHEHTEACLLAQEPEPPEPEYLCGLEEHFHRLETCYDQYGWLVCPLEEHEHTEACLLPPEPEPVSVYQYEDAFISVTAVPEDPEALPAGAQFRVTQVDQDTDGYQYDAYMQALEELCGPAAAGRNAALYDIAFLAEQTSETGETQLVEFQPEEGSVQILFTFKTPQTLDLSEEREQKLQVLHLLLTPWVREQAPTTAEATEITAGDVLAETVEADVFGDTVEFSLDSFSLVAFVTQEDGSVIPIEEVTPGLDYNYRDVLGSAINYGITANEVHKVAHMDTTFAAFHLSSDGGNITTGAYTGGKGSPLLIGSITGSLSIDGKTNIVYTTEEAAQNITLQNGSGSSFQYRTEQEIKSQIDSMLSHAEQVSQIMAAQRTYSVMKYGTYWNGTENVEGWYVDQNEKEINLSNLPDGTYYIDGDTFLDKNDIKIKKNPGQTVVFNLESTAVNLKRFEVVDAQTGQSVSSANSNGDVYPYASTVIFNMPNAETVNIESGIFGVLIAPNATVSIGSTSSGWIVADTVTNPGGEWHFVHQELTEPLPVTVAAKKTLDGEAPDEHTEFSFKVERWDDTTQTWEEEQTVQNYLGDILFRETFSEDGTYYYRVSELNGGGEYQYDTTQYIVKIDVTAIQGNILQAEQTIYKTGDKSQLNDGTKTTEILFQNTTGQPGYVLPETGGAGITLFTAGGAALLALAGLMYPVLRGKGGEAP